MKIKYAITYLLGILSSLLLHAQNFTYQCGIDSIKKNGLHKIELHHQLLGQSAKDLHDIRVVDTLGKEVPYVLLSEPLLRTQANFVPYKINSLTHYNQRHYRFFFFDSYTELTIENPNKDKINNLSLNLNNSDAYKYCAVEGSDDLKNWYSVSEYQELSLAYDNNYTNTYKCIYFPTNNYRYFRLVIGDRGQRPFKINAVGWFKNTLISGKLTPIKHRTTITQNEKEKVSRIQLDFESALQVDRISFQIKAPRLYKRQATLFIEQTLTVNHQLVKQKTPLYRFELNSTERLFFDLANVHAQSVWIEIENKDNPPLELDSISCYRLATYLIADFDSKMNYTLKCGADTIKIPEYDLINFVTDVPQLMPKAYLQKLKPIANAPTANTEPQTAFYEQNWFLWVCLGIGALVLILFSNSLLKEMKREK